MNEYSEKIPDPKELEKELGDFLAKKFGGSVKLATPIVMPQTAESDAGKPPPKKGKTIHFDLKPQDLVDYLDQYVVKQTAAKDILATKICTHFNRIKHVQRTPEDFSDMVGVIKNNVLMLGPTGVGKTYMVRLIAKKIGVPFRQRGCHQVQRDGIRRRRCGGSGSGPGQRGRRGYRTGPVWNRLYR